jgi:hypothetical protein
MFVVSEAEAAAIRTIFRQQDELAAAVELHYGHRTGARFATGEARLINTEPWEPPPSMEKRQCPCCRDPFAAPADSEEGRGPDCVGIGKRAAS